MNVLTGGRIPIKAWTGDSPVEKTAMDQARMLSDLPYAFKHIAIMPDVHAGYGMPIGGVLATKNVLVPNAVGLDIGCGMALYSTGITIEYLRPYLSKILDAIRDLVPVGFNSREKPLDKQVPIRHSGNGGVPIVVREFENAKRQMGTLGGGNHFIELQVAHNSSNHSVFIMVHTGSRNLGKQIADHYHKTAVELCEKYYSSVPKDMSFLPVGTQEYVYYKDELEYATMYAKMNRETIIRLVVKAINEVTGSRYEINKDEINDSPHNFARIEHHFGKNVIVHRKGATAAREGDFVIIPGSQGTSSFIALGRGEAASFESCSHGSGRAMSRKAAREKLSLKDVQQYMKNKGVIHTIKTKHQLDEAPMAYKDIDEVMRNQKDLVQPVQRLTPIASVKG